VRTLADIRPEMVQRFLTHIAEHGASKRANGRLGKGTGATMRNNYLDTLRRFTRWCVKPMKLLGEDPLADLQRAKAPPRRQRRALTSDELVRLLQAARERPVIEKRTIRSGRTKGQLVDEIRNPRTRAACERLGRERALIYKAAVYTGLRRGELAAVQVRYLRLDGKRPCVTLPKEVTKNKEGANIPLRADLVQDLKGWIAETGRAGTDRLFHIPIGFSRVLRKDLEWAGIPYKDELGRTVDVHALRHTTGSHLGLAKVNPRIAQRFMRHKDIRLTLETYNDPSLADENEALDALPDLK
jgi:integrase